MLGTQASSSSLPDLLQAAQLLVCPHPRRSPSSKFHLPTMQSTKIVDILRTDLAKAGSTATSSIANVRHLSSYNWIEASELMIKEDGKVVPIESTLEIKTRTAYKPIDMQEVLPQLWVSQTPKLVRAYHKQGLFAVPKVEDVTCEMKRWEETHQADPRRLATLIKKITNVVKANGGAGVVKYDIDQDDKLIIWQADGKESLPEDVYSGLESPCKKSDTQDGL